MAAPLYFFAVPHVVGRPGINEVDLPLLTAVRLRLGISAEDVWQNVDRINTFLTDGIVVSWAAHSRQMTTASALADVDSGFSAHYRMRGEKTPRYGSIARLYADRWNFKILYPLLPLLKLSGGQFIPLELIRVRIVV